MWLKHLSIYIVCMSLIGIAGCRQEQSGEVNTLPLGALGPLETVSFEIKGVTVEIEIAVAPAEQSQGLMYRESMPENHGMLFVNQQPRYLSFWMKNTRIPLSIAYIREDGIISNIEKMKPVFGSYDPVERYHSRYKCLYAWEMNQGWFEKHELKAGDKIALPLEEIKRIIAKKK